MSISSINNARRLVFPGKQQVCIESFDPGIPGRGEVRVQTHFSLISTGTENIVFNRLFDPGTNWDDWVKYPFYPGYASVGVVEAVGDGVETVGIGDRVAFRVGHSSHAVVAAASCHRVPDGLPLDEAVWFALAKITFHGAKAASYRLGDSALIIGAGPVGQMSLRWAHASGVASLIVVDTAAGRMVQAREGGATATITLPIDQARQAILEAGQGRLPRVVVDSTGNAQVFSGALTLAADYGTVVIMGDTGQPTKQTLTSDVLKRGLTIVGAHDTHHIPGWNEAAIIQLFFNLAVSGRFSLKGLNSHIFDPEQCADAYGMANRDRAATMGMIFDWIATS